MSMTICESMKDAVEKRLEEKKTITQIGKELCKGIHFPNKKVIRIIKQVKGVEYLNENSDWLGYPLSGITQTYARIHRVEKVKNLSPPRPTDNDLVKLREWCERIKNLDSEVDTLWEDIVFRNEWAKACLKNPGDRMKKIRFHLSQANKELYRLWDDTDAACEHCEYEEKHKHDMYVLFSCPRCGNQAYLQKDRADKGLAAGKIAGCPKCNKGKKGKKSKKAAKTTIIEMERKEEIEYQYFTEEMKSKIIKPRMP